MLRFHASIPDAAVTNEGAFVADGDGRAAVGLVGDLVEQAGGSAWIEADGTRYTFGFVFISDLLFALPDVIDALERGENAVVHSVEQGVDETLHIAAEAATLWIESHGKEVIRSHVDVRILAGDLAAFVRHIRVHALCLQPDDAAACAGLLADAEARLNALAAQR